MSDTVPDWSSTVPGQGTVRGVGRSVFYGPQGARKLVIEEQALCYTAEGMIFYQLCRSHANDRLRELSPSAAVIVGFKVP